MKNLELEAFCDRVENEFFRLKGRPGSLSPADFERTTKWFEGGWPIAAVIEGVRNAFAAVDSGRGAGVEEVNSLHFCEVFVEEAVRARRTTGPKG